MSRQYQRPGYTSSRSQPNGLYDTGRDSYERGLNGAGDRPSSSRSREGRGPGGYGGFYDQNDGTPATPPLLVDQGRHSPQRIGATLTAPSSSSSSLRRGLDRDEPRGFANSSSRSRERDLERELLNGSRGARQGGGPGRKRIEDVLQHIQQEWDFMTDEKCIPVQVALHLMDSSSLGRAHQYDQFQSTHKQLQKALKAIVNEHHQGFSSSIGTFHQVQGSIQSSQLRVQTLKESLVQAKSSLSTAKPELRSLATSSQRYDDMLQTLSQIEQLQLIPEKLEARISEKRFLTAVEILQGALKMIRKPEMEDIGALNDLRLYLGNQENSLTDILIEELHSHLYLKSPYCVDRWKPYAQTEGKGLAVNGNAMHTVLPSGKPVYQFLEKLDTSTPMAEDASRNPEADSFYYIQLLIESLNKMGQLDQAVDSIEQRLPIELFRVVEKTNNEVANRHPDTIRNVSRRPKENDGFGLGDKEPRKAIISDLLWTLYSKFEAIAEGHRVLHDVIQGIVHRQNKPKAAALTGGFKELWKLYQSEIRSLLHDYLATNGSIAARKRQSQSAGSGGLFQRVNRDKARKMFKLSDIDHKAIEISAEQEDLELILKSSVPGLVSDSRRADGAVTDDNAQLQENSATGHRLLVEPSVFNMGLLLPPSLSFIKRLKDIVPQQSDIVMSTLTSFLDDFLVNVFHPQLDETLVELSAATFVHSDAFQEDPQWSRVAKQPILKGASRFFNLITAFCEMLDTIPHDQAFSQLIITQMTTYYEKCLDWFQTLTTSLQSPAPSDLPRSKSAAEYAVSGEIHDALLSLLSSPTPQLVEKINNLLILDTNAAPLSVSDLVVCDRRTTTSLCLLYTSMKWLATKILSLRFITPQTSNSSHPPSVRQPRRWTLLSAPQPLTPRSESPAPYLPMTPDSASLFDTTLESYHSLSTLTLLTLHISLRFNIIYHISLSLTEEPYLLPPPPLHDPSRSPPSASILTLNSSLITTDDIFATNLPKPAHTFLTSGLALLTDTMLVVNASHIGVMNETGCERVRLNILVLQQGLRNIEKGERGGGAGGRKEVRLGKSGVYFGLFGGGVKGIVEAARKIAGGEGVGGTGERYSYDELKTLMELCFSERMGSERREVGVAAKRELGEGVLGLSEVLWAS